MTMTGIVSVRWERRVDNFGRTERRIRLPGLRKRRRDAPRASPLSHFPIAVGDVKTAVATLSVQSDLIVCSAQRADRKHRLHRTPVAGDDRCSLAAQNIACDSRADLGAALETDRKVRPPIRRTTLGGGRRFGRDTVERKGQDPVGVILSLTVAVSQYSVTKTSPKAVASPKRPSNCEKRCTDTLPPPDSNPADPSRMLVRGRGQTVRRQEREQSLADTKPVDATGHGSSAPNSSTHARNHRGIDKFEVRSRRQAGRAPDRPGRVS